MSRADLLAMLAAEADRLDLLGDVAGAARLREHHRVLSLDAEAEDDAGA